MFAKYVELSKQLIKVHMSPALEPYKFDIYKTYIMLEYTSQPFFVA